MDSSASSSSCLIMLIGDSDIFRWPKQYLPIPATTDSCLVHGQSGALLDQVVNLTEQALLREPQQTKQNANAIHVVVCAGENDIGVGIPLQESERALQRLVDIVCQAARNDSPNKDYHLIFLGPKLEPWLQDDTPMRKAYIGMSQSFDRILRNQNSAAIAITFIDCLTMFSTDESANELPGSLMGGRAVADPRYFFDPDQLHLSDLGYQVWQQEVNEVILAKQQQQPKF